MTTPTYSQYIDLLTQCYEGVLPCYFRPAYSMCFYPLSKCPFRDHSQILSVKYPSPPPAPAPLGTISINNFRISDQNLYAKEESGSHIFYLLNIFTKFSIIKLLQTKHKQMNQKLYVYLAIFCFLLFLLFLKKLKLLQMQKF